MQLLEVFAHHNVGHTLKGSYLFGMIIVSLILIGTVTIIIRAKR